MQRYGKRTLAGAVTVLATMALPAAASASIVSMSGTDLLFKAGAKPTALTVSGNAFTDAAQALTAGAGCAAGVPVLCGYFETATLQLSAGNDKANAVTSSFLYVNGAGGADTISASGQYTEVNAGPGADSVSVGSNGGAKVIAGDGDDDVRTGPGLEADLAGNGGDDLLWSNQPMQNTVNGGTGNDDLFAVGYGYGTVLGGAGQDAIIVRADGPYSIDGGADADTIYGGGGDDTVAGGAGADLISVTGGGHDTVDCGTGYDRVWADATDSIAASCEAVSFGLMTRPPAADRALAHLGTAFPAITPPAL